MNKQFIIRRHNGSYHVINTATDRTVERCHNLATARMYAVRFNQYGTRCGMPRVVIGRPS